ncbi:NUDIX domain-containing protein [Glycomyces rhizosphaerae]|uniref:NUDIX domain-containing protein n=1 Tax=Glycomyces rhizosphaerae TaxID=2054422 RepID=A0ABV7PZW8_9ACTN
MSATNEPTRIDRRGARGIIVDEQDCVLFIGGYATPDRPARWILPGGGIDPGETMRDAAARELYEETGLRVSHEDLIGPVARQHYRKVHPDRTFTQENHFFLVRVERFEPRVTGGDAYEQDLQFNWIPVDEFLTTDGFEQVEPLRQLVKQLIGGDIPAEPVELETIGRQLDAA